MEGRECHCRYPTPSPQLSVMQGELKTVKEFRKCRAEMEAQLAQLRVTLTESDREHQAALQSLEQRFFEEKVYIHTYIHVGLHC